VLSVLFIGFWYVMKGIADVGSGTERSPGMRRCTEWSRTVATWIRSVSFSKSDLPSHDRIMSASCRTVLNKKLCSATMPGDAPNWCSRSFNGCSKVCVQPGCGHGCTMAGSDAGALLVVFSSPDLAERFASGPALTSPV
jgi:hypothetical protein